ncbi:hypothetical protein CJ218_04990 [Gemella sanguinis]|uniref:DUF1310 domain-containing protein n=1 Tax=Gemella sanguinis TaxID=84135 RepID=A0A2N6SEZ3_9BACL|nr:hypothetical protein CJ218_04990 [Gemella sanguinis]
MKKVLKGILIVLLLVIGSVGLIFGKEYIESKRIERIVKSDEAKKAIESMLMDIDDKALTSEGVIKSYKIDYGKVRKNPMGGINIIIIVNNDDELFIETTLSKYSQNGNYETGGLGVSRKLSELGIPREG